MDAAVILLVLLVAGVNFGWRPAAEHPDSLEYIVQVEPELLDALRRGDAVPIESNVPADIGPIRKVSIKVGRGEVPREPVRNLQQTAYFGAEPGWTSGQTSAPPPTSTSAINRYALPSTNPATDVGPPPSVLNRAQAAVTESGTALRDGIEAGIQAANQQLTRAGEGVVDATRSAGQEFGRQLQGMERNPAGQFQSAASGARSATGRTLGAVGNSEQQITATSGRSNTSPPVGGTAQGGVAPPPFWPEDPQASGSAALRASNPSSMATSDRVGGGLGSGDMRPMQTATGWTSIGSNVAAPVLVIPQLSPSVTAPLDNEVLTADRSGPGFPMGAPSDRYHQSILPRDGAPLADSISTDPRNQQNRQGADLSENWTNGGGAAGPNAPATIGRFGNATPMGDQGRASDINQGQPPIGSGVAPIPPTSQQGASAWGNPWEGNDPWDQPPRSDPGKAVTQDTAGRRGSQTSIDSAPTPQVMSGNGVGAPTTALTQPADSQSPTATPAIEGPPWMPFLVVCLSLVGSLSANLFLGWSYLDARQRYRSLVRKTADTFRRVTSKTA